MKIHDAEARDPKPSNRQIMEKNRYSRDRNWEEDKKNWAKGSTIESFRSTTWPQRGRQESSPQKSSLRAAMSQNLKPGGGASAAP